MFRHEGHSMSKRNEIGESFPNRRRRRTQGPGRSDTGRRVRDVVSAMQPRALKGKMLSRGGLQHGSIPSNEVTRAAEAHQASGTPTCLLLTDPISPRDDCDIFVILVDEGVALRLGVPLKARVPIEMILGYVEQNADFGLKLDDTLQLKAGHFNDQAVPRTANGTTERSTQISARERAQPGLGEHECGERSDSTLPIRSTYRDDWSLEVPRRKLELAD